MTNGSESEAVSAATLRGWIKARIAERCGAQDRDATAVVELDQTRTGRLSRIDALQGQAMAQAAAGRRDRECARLRAALVRLSDPEQSMDAGRCVECDATIAPARLRIDPAATLCVACAEAAEGRRGIGGGR
ncbi:MAG: TraR/DksA C4-type zinc finger protein [Thioalkalivibrionaceae bacterium]